MAAGVGGNGEIRGALAGYCQRSDPGPTRGPAAPPVARPTTMNLVKKPILADPGVVSGLGLFAVNTTGNNIP
jgi:hypothetical protein